jgi:hypothetical protein
MNSTDIKHIKRWIVASAIKLFKTLNEGVALYIEGEDNLIVKNDKHLEIRIDGPYSKPLANNEYRHYVEINILVNSTRSENDFYERHNLQGIAAQILNRDICVYKIGNVGKNSADDQSFVGVLRLLPNDMIKTSDFGRINETTEVYQSVAEAHYEMYT